MNRKEIVHRLVQMLLALVGVSFLTFCLMYLSPGDPVEMLLEVGDTIVSEETIAETRAQLGLDQPFHIQYIRWFTGVLQGDMGMSYSAKIPVAERLWQCLPGTLVLAGSALVMMLLISVPCGILSAVYRNRMVDYLIRGISFLGVSMPSFWVGLILLYVLGLKLRLFPVAGGVVSLDRMVLPALTLAIAMSAKYTRQVRTAVLEELGQDYIIGARTRGFPMRKILWRHVLPNACLPLVTLLGLSIGWLLGGVAVIEMVFSWPGLGKMAVHAIEMRDYPLVQGFVLWIAILYTGINLLVDISYTYLDPRLKKGAC
ncbi:nickel ABC transporter permease [Sporomusa sp. KB1]|uniref:nickel ABC transporter permease n=1 Tax=Sporomusa sp. KB1 TaxID=943346 RepID=UPI0011A341E7|nr:nickel ABC transporter permease [Sporomusa sp. KB1]TWH49166.1 peptide/nickel transport system permease protein [Sporomusa sp. KB1]